MKLVIFTTEWYPVLALSDSEGFDENEQIVVDEDTAERWRKAFAAFDALQAELHVAKWGKP